MVNVNPLIKEKYFILSIVLYAIVQLSRHYEFYLPEFLNNYLTDFLCMPIVLTLCLFGIRVIHKKEHLELNGFMIISMTLFYAVLFEFILPKYSTNYTADPLDVMMYFFGTLFFWVIRTKFKLNLSSKA